MNRWWEGKSRWECQFKASICCLLPEVRLSFTFGWSQVYSGKATSVGAVVVFTEGVVQSRYLAGWVATLSLPLSRCVLWVLWGLTEVVKAVQHSARAHSELRRAICRSVTCVTILAEATGAMYVFTHFPSFLVSPGVFRSKSKTLHHFIHKYFTV